MIKLTSHICNEIITINQKIAWLKITSVCFTVMPSFPDASISVHKYTNSNYSNIESKLHAATCGHAYISAIHTYIGSQLINQLQQKNNNYAVNCEKIALWYPEWEAFYTLFVWKSKLNLAPVPCYIDSMQKLFYYIKRYWYSHEIACLPVCPSQSHYWTPYHHCRHESWAPQ